MEQNLSILIADLSGYTALTETHGSISAADLIDRYVEIVNASLKGESKLQERVGDEVMIISASPADLLTTAITILQTALGQHHFLQIHGALHYGKLLKRGNSYFGSALNLTSRIASNAGAGTFLCSRDFVDAISDKSICEFKSIGNYSFKNVLEEKEIFEIICEKSSKLYIDPICRMIISREVDFLSHPSKNGLLFCSQNCLDTYLKNELDQENS
jgi:class 3 adenylate cyclase/YHS domain-containing protein